jgi:hypothetical protein
MLISKKKIFKNYFNAFPNKKNTLKNNCYYNTKHYLNSDAKNVAASSTVFV